MNIVPVDLKKLSNLVNKEVVKNTELEKLNLKVNSVDNKIYDEITLIYIKTLICKYNTRQINKVWTKKNKDVDKKNLRYRSSNNYRFLMQKSVNLKTKYQILEI